MFEDQADPNSPQREPVPFPAFGPPMMASRMPAFAQPQVAIPQQVTPEQFAQAQAVIHAAQQQQQFNGQPAAPAARSPEYQAVEVRQRLNLLKQGSGAGLFDMADFMAEAIASYQQQYQQRTGQAITFRDALDQVYSTLALVCD